MTAGFDTNTNPFLREIFDQGFTHVEENLENYVLYNRNKNLKKEIPKMEFLSVISKCTVLGSNEYKWISEGDGSYECFKKFLANSPS